MSTQYKGYVLDYAPARPTPHRYIATRFGKVLCASHPAALLALVNNDIHHRQQEAL